MILVPRKHGSPLANYTTFRIGGPARVLFEATSANEVLDAIENARKMGFPWYVLGHGSNILVSDNGYDGVVIVFKDEHPPLIHADGTVTASGGYPLSKLIQLMSENGLGGLENLAGIPGTVGGAIAGNAGAYGTAIGERIRSVQLLTRDSKIQKLEQNELEFSYRSSIIKKTCDVVLEATFSTDRRDSLELTKIIESRLSDRKCKHPDWNTIATAGSYFKNPIAADGTRIAAGRLLEEAGCKGLRVGGAHLWHKHANIIVTNGNAKASDVKKLAEIMSQRVYERFGITLSPEVVYLA